VNINEGRNEVFYLSKDLVNTEDLSVGVSKDNGRSTERLNNEKGDDYRYPG
jgi:hypothetical protein